MKDSESSVRTGTSPIAGSGVGNDPKNKNSQVSKVKGERSDAGVRIKPAGQRTFVSVPEGRDSGKSSTGKLTPTERSSADRGSRNTVKIDGAGRGSTEVGRKIRDNRDRDVKSIDTNNNTVVVRDSAGGRERYYEDRHHNTMPSHHRSHVYRDHYRRYCHTVVLPSYHFGLYYSWGSSYRHHYVYPYYHRRYMFVSLNGCWPSYSYLRYHWYPSHYYDWYGYHPVAYQGGGDTNNYYTYNYYNDNQQTYVSPELTQAIAEPEPPAEEGLADIYFDGAVKSFEEADYIRAAEQFETAMSLAPDDKIVPFAYAQSLFASGQYGEAAATLRAALKDISPEKDGIFYPRGLYLDEEVLLAQIDLLAAQSELFDKNTDLQLLLGYHLIGIGESSQAVKPLIKASSSMSNCSTSTVLLQLAEKLNSHSNETNL